ncbi:MAG TPA: hypothetical protein VH817_20980 [Thermoleophilaceae bacterium]|jgi:hypothetical protein
MHAALELALAAALMLLPYAIGLSPTAVVVGIGVGALLAGLAIAGSEPGSRGGLPLSAHAVYDWAAGTGLICAGIVLGFASGPAALAVFLAAGLAELTLTASTSYSASRA